MNFGMLVVEKNNIDAPNTINKNSVNDQSSMFNISIHCQNMLREISITRISQSVSPTSASTPPVALSRSANRLKRFTTAMVTIVANISATIRPVGLLMLYSFQVGMSGCMTTQAQNFQTAGCSIAAFDGAFGRDRLGERKRN